MLALLCLLSITTRAIDAGRGSHMRGTQGLFCTKHVGFDPPEGEEQKGVVLVTSRASFALMRCGCLELVGMRTPSDDGHWEGGRPSASPPAAFERGRHARMHTQPRSLVQWRPGGAFATLPLNGCARPLSAPWSPALPQKETSSPPLTLLIPPQASPRTGSPQPLPSPFSPCTPSYKYLARSFAQRFHC